VFTLLPLPSLVSLPGDVAALIQAECFARGIEVLSVSVAADEVRTQYVGLFKTTTHLIYSKREASFLTHSPFQPLCAPSLLVSSSSALCLLGFPPLQTRP
jgi:hypothetical protein